MKERTPGVTAGTVAAHRAIGTSRLPEKLALWIYERAFPAFTHTSRSARGTLMIVLQHASKKGFSSW